RLELGTGAVPVRAIRMLTRLPLELGRHADEDAVVPRVRPAPVYAVSTPYRGHRPPNIAANCGFVSLIRCLCLNGQFDPIAQVPEQGLYGELAAAGALE